MLLVFQKDKFKFFFFFLNQFIFETSENRNLEYFLLNFNFIPTVQTQSDTNSILSKANMRMDSRVSNNRKHAVIGVALSYYN